MRILAIETSCDDTAVAVLKIQDSKFKILSNIVSSQEIHQNYGGVFPMMAKREHQRNLVPVLKQALKQAKLLNPKHEALNPKQIPNSKLKTIQKILDRESDLFARMVPFLQKYEKPDVDLIAVTNGPGLEPCLWVGVNFAKVLSYVWNIPVIAVNHIEAHILINFLKDKKYHIYNGRQKYGTFFPAVALVVSGGHTQLILVKGIGKYKIIGETRDDAAGECFDKCAKILGLGYPGGPAIAKIASQFLQARSLQSFASSELAKLPRPMMNSKDFDFSFSGLKTAVLYKARDMQKSKFQSSPSFARASVGTRDFPAKREIPSSGRQELWNLPKQFVQEMCVEVQQAIVDVLIKKTIKAVKDYNAKIPTTKLSRIHDGRAIGTIILGGGVSANQELRRQIALKAKSYKLKAKILIPNTKYSTDNALMIAMTAWFYRHKKVNLKNLRAEANLRID